MLIHKVNALVNNFLQKGIRMKKALVIFYISICTIAFSSINEIRQFKEVLNYIQPNSLVICDIDNTLLEPAQLLGSDQWFTYRRNQKIEEGFTNHQAIEHALIEFLGIQNCTKVNPVEPSTPSVIDTLQAHEEILVMGLTTRGIGLSFTTAKQLNSIGIDLVHKSPTYDEIHFMNPRGNIFRNGILFTSGTHKGTSLFKFFNKIDYAPEHIVFIDDKLLHIKEVQAECERNGVSFVGLRYGFLDEKVKNFSPEIVEVQMKEFGKIMSDQEALLLIDSQEEN